MADKSKHVTEFVRRDVFVRAERDGDDYVEFNGYTTEAAVEFVTAALERGWDICATRRDHL